MVRDQGLNRGGLTGLGVTQKKRLTHFSKEMSCMKQESIQSAVFPGQGVVVFGQKTLQSRPSSVG